jgi:hypothetical protein
MVVAVEMPDIVNTPVDISNVALRLALLVLPMYTPDAHVRDDVSEVTAE